MTATRSWPAPADPLALTEGGITLHVKSLGHVVLKVRDLQRSENFYSGMLGMPIVSRNADPCMTFFALETSGNHHDFALMEVSSDAPAPGDGSTGLAHVAFEVGSIEELVLARGMFDASGTGVLYEAERGSSRSVHVLDPDGNEVELYVDLSHA
jgi:catechol-2,3-dioxygenase